MKFQVNAQVHLSEFRSSDKDALVEHLNDRDIYERTLRIPFPYTNADAEFWLALVAKITAEQGRPIHWAIRGSNDGLIGGCGFESLAIGKSHEADIGYWLARPFWGRGIMTDVVKHVCQHAFKDLGLVKITAHVFVHNPASARVLQKCGFQQEGLLLKHFLKDEEYIDCRLFGLVSESR
jgi:RimJ/RimL family protein N-acetyltransferase